MQLITLSVVLFAALVTASQHGEHFHHRRHYNVSSSVAADEMTTLTVCTTNIRTVTRCANTITDCPAESATHINVVTDIIAITTTVCPITAAEAASSAAIAAAGGSYTKSAAMPVGTGNSGAGTGYGVVPSSGGFAVTETSRAGSSTSYSTTTIKQTTTVTEEITVYETRRSSPSAAAAIATGEVVGYESAASVEPTTTHTSYSTSTKYITVSLVHSVYSTVASNNEEAAVTGGSYGSSDSGSTGKSPDSGACLPITVTVAQTTIYATITYTAMGASPTIAQAVAKTEPPEVSPCTTELAAITPASSSENDVVTISAAPSGGVPYGYTNGTEPLHHKSSYHRYSGSSTGFLTVSKPTGSVITSASAGGYGY